MSRETQYALHFAGVSYYDGQGFMVPRGRKLASALELDGSMVCVQSQTTTVANLPDYFRANNMKYTEKRFHSIEEVLDAYKAGQCDTLTSDVSQLYALRLKLPKPADHVILADVISKEPLGPVVRQKDDQWLLIVKWVLFAMIDAEELGISSQNIDAALKSQKPEVRRFVGNDGDYGADIGLPKDWAVRVIRRVGNYGEVYERNVGNGSPLGIPRGLNQLWDRGGILYTPPIR
jgi:general L-amino acid transport system substrate-binding protein